MITMLGMKMFWAVRSVNRSSSLGMLKPSTWKVMMKRWGMMVSHS